VQVKKYGVWKLIRLYTCEWRCASDVTKPHELYKRTGESVQAEEWFNRASIHDWHNWHEIAEIDELISENRLSRSTPLSISRLVQKQGLTMWLSATQISMLSDDYFRFFLWKSLSLDQKKLLVFARVEWVLRGLALLEVAPGMLPNATRRATIAVN
jgi:hypothetical protein